MCKNLEIRNRITIFDFYMLRQFTIILLFLICTNLSVAQNLNIIGNVEELTSRIPLVNVSILNIHTNEETRSSTNGDFKIKANNNDLLVFKINGYKTVRVRIPNNPVPSYFKIQMQAELPKYVVKDSLTGDWVKDSTRYARMYARELGFSRFSASDYLLHPFSAMFNNKMYWKFQDHYKWFEDLKLVNDYAFSNEILKKLTNLPPDSTEIYRKRFALSADQVRSMNKYDLYLYIKETVEYYRTGVHPRFGPVRLSN